MNRWAYIVAVLVAVGVVVGLLNWGRENAPATREDARTTAELLVEASEADFANDLDLTKSLLHDALAAGGSAEDRAEAERRLARLAWKNHHDFDGAVKWLAQAASREVSQYETWLEHVRLELKRERFDAARHAADQAIRSATSRTERLTARGRLAQVLLEEATSQRLQGQVVDEGTLRLAHDTFVELVRETPGDPEPSRGLIGTGLLLDDGAAVLTGWRSFYHVAPGEPGPNQVADAGAALRSLMATWRGVESRAEDRVALVKALAGSRLYTEAALVALDSRLPDGRAGRDAPAVREVVAYAAFCRSVRALSDEYYRQTILGGSAYADFERELARSVRTLWNGLLEPSAPSPTRDFARALTAELGPRFGTVLKIERVGRYRNIRMGHRVIDETRRIEQYGHRVELRFVSLGSMVSNGYRSWAWNSSATTGGWAEHPTITQVREAYASGPTRAWRLLTDPAEQARLAEEIADATAEDWVRARRNPVAFMPGLDMRLRHQGREQLMDRLASRGLTGEALRLAFLAEYERVTVESSIFAHEGRHAIHKARRGFLPARSAEKEFRAKLSEVAFAPEPRLSLGAIINLDIGNDTGHGEANERIMRGLVAWMSEHGAEIEALDPTRPLLPQFDRLTDDQMRAAFRSMDPLAPRGR